MESQPLIAKSNIVPNLDVSYLIREIFRAELESHVPSKKLAENLRKSLEYERLKEDFEGQRTFRSVSFLENLPNEKGKLMDFAEKVFDAYGNHEEALSRIAKAELNIMETQAIYLRRETMIRENDFLQDLLRLKRHPLMKSYNPDYVKQYKLLQGESGLPPDHEANIDFRVKDFQKCKKRVTSASQDSLAMRFLNGKRERQDDEKIRPPKKENLPAKGRAKRPKKTKAKEEKQNFEIFRAEPSAVCFVDYTPGNAYACTVTVRNVHTKPIKFFMKPLPIHCPFKVKVDGRETSRILPGLGFKLVITFEPQSLDDENEHLIVLIEDGSRLVIPLASYLEPPVLKTHEELDEFTRNVPERIRCSYIDCGACFPGDSKVTKIRFYSFGGTGEFFAMSQENWNDWHISCLTSDNFTDIPPFRLYPSYFKIDKSQVIDLYVEFKPMQSGLHSESIIIACSNGEIRNLDILGDGISWNRSFISFEKFLEKDFPPYKNDDQRAAYYLDMGGSLSTGRTRKAFCLSNSSNVPFEFRWEMRDAVILFKGQEEPKKLTRTQVRVEPSSGILEPHADQTFVASVSFEKSPVGQYRTVLSFYIVGLPYQSIEQACTIIRPSVTVAPERFKSGSVFGEEDNLPPSPEFSYQDTYESVQESMKSTESKNQQQFPTTVCRKHSSVCAIPLKKSKTYSNIGEGNDECTCCATSAPRVAEPDKSHSHGSGNLFKKREKPNITDLGSNLLWDFVDVLVDEIELWAEVLLTVVTLEPTLISTCDDVRIKAPPVRYDVYVHNQNKVPVTCKWLEFMEKPLSQPEENYKLRALYPKEGTREVKVSDDETAPHNSHSLCGEDGEWGSLSKGSSTCAESTENYNPSCCASRKLRLSADDVPHVSATNVCDIKMEPTEAFTIPPQSRFACAVSVAASEAGIISRELYLTVEDGEQVLRLWVVGRVPDGEITVTPPILDFGTRRRGALYEKHFKIRNESTHQVEWRVEQYKFNYDTQHLSESADEEMQSNLKRVQGVLEEGGSAIESYQLDARKAGLQTSILKFEPLTPALMKTRSKYVVVLADVQTPQLAIEAPRFNNAILAPSKTICQWVFPKVHSKGTVWAMMELPGSSLARVRNLQSSPTGIVEHCYVPCFFSRNVNPVVLSIVGIIKNLRVTFEVANESTRFCNNLTVMKISWPMKNFDPQIGMSHIPESEILDFVCHCDEVDAEYLRATNAEEKTPEQMQNAIFPAEDVAEILHPEKEPVKMEREYKENRPCLRQYNTVSSMRKLRRNATEEKKVASARDTEEEFENEEQDSEEPGSENSAAAVKHPRARECIDFLYYAISEIKFVNVLSKTVAVKHFVIRNETPISTTFALRVRYFAKTEQSDCKDKLKQMKKYIFGRKTGELECSLMYGQPLLITTSPSGGTLDGWDSVRVSVFVFGNTWGEYRDFIVCDICGMPSFILKVSVQLSGHPVLFPMFKTSLLDIPVLRFNTVKYKSDAVVRNIRVRNTSAVPVTVTWMVFLTSPLSEVRKDEPFNLCLDLYTDKDSEDPEKTTKSSQNYLSKNTSGSAPLLDTMDVDRISSRCTGIDEMSEMESGKRDGPYHVRCFRSSGSNGTPALFTDSTKPEIQLLENYGKMDLHVFQVAPRELDLEPYSQEKMSVTFDPNYYEQSESLQEFEAVVTGCVRLKQEYALYPDIYKRPCGKDYVSKLLFLSAAVEKPLLQLDMFRDDLRYVLNANEVVKMKGNAFGMTKKYLIKNRSQTAVSIKVKVEPGEVFSVRRIETFGKVFAKFDSDYHQLTIQPGNSVEVQLEMTVSRNQIREMFKTFKLDTPKTRKGVAASKSSQLILAGDIQADGSCQSVEQLDKESGAGEKIYVGSTTSRSGYDLSDGDSNSGVAMRQLDSYQVFENKAREWKSARKMEHTAVKSFGTGVSEEEFPWEPLKEFYGEDKELIPGVDRKSQETDATDQSFVVTEDLIFEQVGLVRQVVTPELHVIFPSLRLNPEVIDFGNVHIGETSRRYASVTNLTKFPTEFRVTWSGETEEFSISPLAAKLPATNCRSDSGVELAIAFTPKYPGYFKKSFKIYGNMEMEFQFFVLTVLGFGTWNEKYKYPETECSIRLPPIVSSFRK